MKNFFKKALVILLALVLAIPTVNGVEVKAASKPTLSQKKKTIGLGSGSEYEPYSIRVENAVEGAKYVFKSKNKDVVTVKKAGTECYLTGVSTGTAKIQVKQKLDGKTTKIGTCKVTVVGASVPETVEVYVGQMGDFDFVSDYYGYYWYEVQDTDILKVSGGVYQAIAEGTTTIDFWYYNNETGEKGDFIGTTTIIVKKETE